MMIVEFYQSHPMWSWLAVAGIILAVEIGTGSGWLLWPAACAVAVALMAAVAPGLGLPVELSVFAGLTIVTSLTARKYLPKRQVQPGEDINNRAKDLVGKVGQVTGSEGGRLRVLVDGAEWEAESEDGFQAGDRVRVRKVLGGARIAVEAA